MHGTVSSANCPIFKPISPDPISVGWEAKGCWLFTLDVRMTPDDKLVFFHHPAIRLPTALDQAIERALNPDGGPAPGAPTPLDIVVQEPSYVFIRFRPGLNFQFSAVGDGVSLKPDHDSEPDAAYGELWHIFSQNDRVPGGGEMKDGCQLVCFAVDPPAPPEGEFDPYYSDGLNFHVEVLQTDRDGRELKLPIIIDPDIKYPGDQG